MLFRLKTCRKTLLLLYFLFLAPLSWAQAPAKPNAAEILLKLQKLNVVGSALYVAAHPDDENTALIAWLANEKLLNTGYLSLTRGDGGQNLIGPEIRERLGLIRTQELLQARRLDGGNQFFTRANDFGFSKDYQETLRIWDKEKVLSDMVWTIRKFRPDVMITRFSPQPGGTHGHHTTSAILAGEAFEAAADPKRFPEQLTQVQIWQPKRLLWNTSSFFYGQDRKFDPTGKIAIPVSTYNPLLGKSYTEIAAASRSMHKSQGFGSGSNYGEVIDYLEHTKGDRATQDLFEGINTTWSRLNGGEKVGKLIQKAIQQYKAQNPAASVPALLEVKTAISQMPPNAYKENKLNEVQEIIKACLGLFLETTVSQSTATPQEEISLSVLAVNRSTIPVQLQQVTILPTQQVIQINKNLTKELVTTKTPLTLPANTPVSQPYWLQETGTVGMYAVNNPALIGLPENHPALSVAYSLTINKEPFTFTVPVQYKRVDPVDGEIYTPFVITPPLFLSLAEPVYVFADANPKAVQVKLKASRENQNGTVQLQLPPGWRAEPASLPFSLKSKDEEQTVIIQVFPSANQSEGNIKAVATVNGQTYENSLVRMQYNHIPPLTIFPAATAKVARLDLKKKGTQIGYLMGAGDEVPVSLSQVGYAVTLLKPEALSAENLKQFDAVVIGVRAYNTVQALKFGQSALNEYVKNGGTVLSQYNVSSRLVTDQVGPFPLKITSGRVTDEEAPIQFLKPEHRVLNYPNKISQADFKGWVQERGLYFPGEWDAQYEAILSAQDPGEAPQTGGLLVAKYGKGYYIYTGYAFFRQLPAGVPGAYRLFTNLISIGK